MLKRFLWCGRHVYGSISTYNPTRTLNFERKTSYHPLNQYYHRRFSKLSIGDQMMFKTFPEHRDYSRMRIDGEASPHWGMKGMLGLAGVIAIACLLYLKKKKMKKDMEFNKPILLAGFGKKGKKESKNVELNKLYMPVDLSKEIPGEAKKIAEEHGFEIRFESLDREHKECDLLGMEYENPPQREEPRRILIAAIQHSIVEPTYAGVKEQRKAIHDKVGHMIDAAGEMGVQILCLPEAWHMPFGFVTLENYPWRDFAEPIIDGPTTNFIRMKSKRHPLMTIISPIFEEDSIDRHWNTAVVVEEGRILGVSRKKHIPSILFPEDKYYQGEFPLEHRVFKTRYGKIAVNICFGRHFPLNWLMSALNEAEVVFNPSATFGELHEMWMIEGQIAAWWNSIVTFSVNRVGVEKYKIKDRIGDHQSTSSREVVFPAFGMTYASGPDGRRTVGLGNKKDGLLVVEVDLSKNRRWRTKLGYFQKGRFSEYAQNLTEFVAENPRRFEEERQ